MSIWDDIKSVGDAIVGGADDALDMGGKTLGSVWSSVSAPAGLVFDLAKMPFDDVDDDFGTFVKKFTKRGGDYLDPIFNPQTISGFALHGAMDAANWAYQEGVDRPLSTANLLMEHAAADRDPSELFDPQAWSKAYDLAKSTSIGETSTIGASGGLAGEDPFDFESGEEYINRLHAALGSGANGFDNALKVAAGTRNLGAMLFLDPTIFGGKALGAARLAGSLHKLRPDEARDLWNLIRHEDEASGAVKTAKKSRIPGRQDPRSRTDAFLDFINGDNPLHRPLNGNEIYYGTKELKDYATAPKEIAGLLADQRRLGDEALIRDGQRRILAVAAGDMSQVDRLRGMRIGNTEETADKLLNMAKGGPLSLEQLAANPVFRHNPELVVDAERQLKNLDNAHDLTNFFDNWNSQIDQIVGTDDTAGIVGSLKNLPGIHASSGRAVNRLNETGKLRALDNAHRAIDAKAAAYWQKAESASTIWQKGRYAMPLVITRAVGLPASFYTKLPVGVSDALRTAQTTGLVRFHQWPDATRELDSMMKFAGVNHETRNELLGRAFIAKTEREKESIVDEVESVGIAALAERWGAKYGDEIDRDFLTNMVENFHGSRKADLTQLRGRVYSATRLPKDMSDEVLREQGLRKQEMDLSYGERVALRKERTKARREAKKEGKSRAEVKSAVAGANQRTLGEWEPRVDQIVDENGLPVALPLVETELKNAMPVMDFRAIEKDLKRNYSFLARTGRAWQEERRALGRLSNLKSGAGDLIEKEMKARAWAMDSLVSAAQKTMRAWKFSVLFRLGYPARVIMDDHWRIWSRMNAMSFYGGNLKESLPNLKSNRKSAVFGKNTRGARARAAQLDDKHRYETVKDLLASEDREVFEARLADRTKKARTVGGKMGHITKLRNGNAQAVGKKTPEQVEEKIRELEADIADEQASINYLDDVMGDFDPNALERELEQLKTRLDRGLKGYLPDKRTIGMEPVELGDGVTIPGAAMGTKGSVSRSEASSQETFDYHLRGVEDRTFRSATGGSFQTYKGTDPGHPQAWADSLQYQIAQSKVGRFFLKGGTAEDFAKWIKEADQADLRKRLPHYAHDPEDWGRRVEAMVYSYAPTEEIRKAALDGRITKRWLQKQIADPSDRPAVHGASLEHTLGNSARPGLVGATVNKLYKAIGELPTDRLSRQPFFNAMYKQHAREHFAKVRASRPEGAKFTQEDLNMIENLARRDAMHDLRRTLFDISAHSHAAHVMRFVSPFFAAHQEVLTRWWRIVEDNPQIIRRFQQAFDIPRYAGLTIDADGNEVAPGDPVSTANYIMLQLPEAVRDVPILGSKWQLNENSFNLVLQGGITNPGAGPFVAVPMGYLANKYADDENLTKINRIFNPYPSDNPLASALPATVKRGLGYAYGKSGGTIDIAGIGQEEYNRAFATEMQDLTADFMKEYGREPNRQESADLMERAGKAATTDMFHRVLWNGLSPAPASLHSKYSVIQDGWYRIAETARKTGKGYDWAYARFKDKYGEAYMPLVYGASNNPADVDPTAATVASIKKNRPLLRKVDPRLTQMVIGPDIDHIDGGDERSGEARAWLQQNKMRSGSNEPYYTYDDPSQAFQDQMARRGWQKYGELTSSLTAMAEDMGLDSYRESDELMEMRSVAVDKLREDNWAFNLEWNERNEADYPTLVEDMRIVADSSLANDPERGDVRTLQKYLALHDTFQLLFQERLAQGLGGPDAESSEPLRWLYTQGVGNLVEESPYFEQYMYNGVIDRDPLLMGE